MRKFDVNVVHERERCFYILIIMPHSMFIWKFDTGDKDV